MALAFQVKQASSQEKGFPVANSTIKGSSLGYCETLPEKEGPKSPRSSPSSFVMPCSSYLPLFLKPRKILQCVDIYSSPWWTVWTPHWLSKVTELSVTPSTLLPFSYKICQTTGEELKRNCPVWLSWDFAHNQRFLDVKIFDQWIPLLWTSFHCFLEPAKGRNGDVADINI